MTFATSFTFITETSRTYAATGHEKEESVRMSQNFSLYLIVRRVKSVVDGKTFSYVHSIETSSM